MREQSQGAWGHKFEERGKKCVSEVRKDKILFALRFAGKEGNIGLRSRF